MVPRKVRYKNYSALNFLQKSQWAHIFISLRGEAMELENFSSSLASPLWEIEVFAHWLFCRKLNAKQFSRRTFLISSKLKSVFRKSPITFSMGEREKCLRTFLGEIIAEQVLYSLFLVKWIVIKIFGFRVLFISHLNATTGKQNRIFIQFSSINI